VKTTKLFLKALGSLLDAARAIFWATAILIVVAGAFKLVDRAAIEVALYFILALLVVIGLAQAGVAVYVRMETIRDRERRAELEREAKRACPAPDPKAYLPQHLRAEPVILQRGEKQVFPPAERRPS
jgi:uncharacterized membrane protein